MPPPGSLIYAICCHWTILDIGVSLGIRHQWVFIEVTLRSGCYVPKRNGADL